MHLRETGIPGAYVVVLDPRRDERGSFMRTFCRDEFARLGLATDFVQANAGTSASRGTLRGLHHQLAPHAEAKTVRCTRGAVFDVVVDARPGSPAYRAWYGVELRAGEPFLVYVPEGCAHGYLTLEDDTEVNDVTTDLDGKKIGVCSACTYEQYLQKSLAIEGFEFDFVIDDADIAGYDTDTTALQDLATGRLDAAITSLTVAQGFIDAGNPVKIVGDPIFYEPLAVGFDKSADPSSQSLQEAVDQIVGEMHEDGTLTSLSQTWYDGTDLTQKQ